MDSDNLVAILAIVMVFGMPVAMYAIYVWYRLRRQRQRNEVIATLAEHGQPVAPELLIEPVPPHADLRRGVIWAVVGLGVLDRAICLRADPRLWLLRLLHLDQPELFRRGQPGEREGGDELH